MDGTAKGGITIAIAKELGMPIQFIGVGEQMDDLLPFEAQPFVDSLFEGHAPKENTFKGFYGFCHLNCHLN